jgi:8-oxo-dGTP diphosphatase
VHEFVVMPLTPGGGRCSSARSCHSRRVQLVVGAVIVDDLLRPRWVLAARRATPASLAGRWEFPGGKVEPGELPQPALLREIREELGVAIELGDELIGPDAGCWPISEHLTMRLWFGRLSGEPRPDVAHDQVRWLDATQLVDVPWLPADVAVAHRLLEHLAR